jgi:hypothetical protein
MTNEPVAFNPEHSPQDFIEAIDRKFKELRGKEDRLSLKWGHFSRGMNVEIRKYLEVLPEETQLREQYHYTQVYWTCKSRLLDLYMRHKLLGKGRIRRENKMANDIKNMILTGEFLRPVKENDIIAQVLGKL